MKYAILLTALIFCFACNNSSIDDKDNCICYEIYAPVCGIDGETYSNDCFARCEGVKEFVPGPCMDTLEGLLVYHGSPAADGCGWLFHVDTVDYHPVDLPDKYLRDSTTLRLKGEKLTAYFYACWNGKFRKLKVLEVL